MKMVTTSKGYKVADIEVDGINTADYPDFCDAFISSASVECESGWRDATEEELDELSSNSDLVYEQVLEFLF
jgi:hypothetical protein